MTKKPLTINDIAAQANVSNATVSRYLNGHYEKMSAATRTRIQQVIDATGFRLNRQAQSLKRQSSHLIGMVVADVENLFSSLLFKGADQVLAAAGYQIVLMNADNDLKVERQQLQRLLELQVDGIILQPVSATAANYAFLKQTQPVVDVVDRQLRGTNWPQVTTDNYRYSAQLTKTVARRGYNQLVVVTPPLGDNTARDERYRAVTDLCEEKKFSQPLRTLIVQPDTSNAKLYQQLHATLKKRTGHTALYVLQGHLLLQVMTVLAENRIEIPEQIGLVAYDDWSLSQLMQPGITTIQQQPRAMGQQVATNVLRQLAGRSVEPLTMIDSTLHERDSLITFAKNRPLT